MTQGQIKDDIEPATHIPLEMPVSLSQAMISWTWSVSRRLLAAHAFRSGGSNAR